MPEKFIVFVNGEEPFYLKVNEESYKYLNIDIHTYIERWVVNKFDFKAYDYFSLNEFKEVTI